MDDLPNELIIEIASYLEDPSLQSTVWSLANVNRRFYSLLIRSLYTAYSSYRGEPELFLRTISSASDLGHSVKYVSWDHNDGHRLSLASKTRSVSTTEQIASKLRTLGSPSAQELAPLFSHLVSAEIKFTDTFLCTLLLFTPNVKALEIANTKWWPNHTHWLKPVAENGHLFTHLTEANVCGPLRINNVLPLFTVPSLRVARLTNISVNRDRLRPGIAEEWETNQDYWKRLHKEGSFVEHLHVIQCYSGTVDVMKLLGVFHRLKLFSFDNCEGRTDADDMYSVLRACVRHNKSLESLRLRDWHEYADAYCLHPLRKFQNLKSLNIALPTFGVQRLSEEDPERLKNLLECLPVCLEELMLVANDIEGDQYSPCDEFVDTLLAVAPSVPSMLPNLRLLAITDWGPLLDIFPCQTQLTALESAFAINSIKFLSLPSLEFWGDCVYSLDHVEPDWVWVQPYQLETGKWLQDLNWGRAVSRLNVEVDDVEEDPDWLIVWSRIDTEGWGSQSIMDEYSSEQPIWYWNQLHPENQQ